MNGPFSFRKPALLSLALLLAAPPSILRAEPAAPPSKELRLSVMPLGTPAESQKMIGPLLNFLEAGLGQHVLIASPSTNLEQYRDALTTRFTLGMVAAQIGGVLIREGSYLLIAAPKAPFTHPTLYVRSESSFHSLDDLREKRVAVPDHTTVTRRRGEADLAALGLRLTEDVALVETHSHTGGLKLLIGGEVDATLLPEAVVLRLHEGVGLRALYRGEPMGSMVVIIDGTLDASLRERIRYLITEPGFREGDEEKPTSPRELLLRRPDWVIFSPVSEEYRAEIERLGEQFTPIIHELHESSPSEPLSDTSLRPHDNP